MFSWVWMTSWGITKRGVQRFHAQLTFALVFLVRVGEGPCPSCLLTESWNWCPVLINSFIRVCKIPLFRVPKPSPWCPSLPVWQPLPAGEWAMRGRSLLEEKGALKRRSRPSRAQEWWSACLPRSWEPPSTRWALGTARILWACYWGCTSRWKPRPFLPGLICASFWCAPYRFPEALFMSSCPNWARPGIRFWFKNFFFFNNWDLLFCKWQDVRNTRKHFRVHKYHEFHFRSGAGNFLMGSPPIPALEGLWDTATLIPWVSVSRGWGLEGEQWDIKAG